ncbi:hypothetical protein JCM8097_008548 [Rhodosporidiobolus ruineniae]
MLLSLVSPLLRAALCAGALLATSSLLVLTLILISTRFSLARNRPRQRKRLLSTLGLADEAQRIVGIFHPYCNAGGGGERVLWTALACMQREEKDCVFLVYTGDVGGEGEEGTVTTEQILAKVAARFDIRLSPSNLHFVPLRKRHLVHDSTWKRFTLVMQSLGSAVLAYEGLSGEEGVVPDVWIDTMGYALAYPVVRYLCCIPVGSYTHYPTISTDMLRRVRLRQAGHTNPSRIAKSWLLSTLKLGYYTLFASIYSWSLRQADVIMVNSTWTGRHIHSLLSSPEVGPEPFSSSTFSAELGDEPTPTASAPPPATLPGPNKLRKRRPGTPSRSSSSASLPSSLSSPRPIGSLKARLVYPPCDTASLLSLPLATSSRLAASNGKTVVFSLAQFRPEKEHHLQLNTLAAVFEQRPELRGRVRLVAAGSVRDTGDSARVEELKKLAVSLGLRVGPQDDGKADVVFEVNKPWSEIRSLMGRASVGLHTMVDEHFGITVVEFQAAGLIPLAHASAGPLLDIVVPYPSSSTTSTAPPGPTGFLAPPPPAPVLPASSPELVPSFASQLLHIVDLSEEEQDAIRGRARQNAQERFAVEVFEAGWRGAWGDCEAHVADRTGRRWTISYRCLIYLAGVVCQMFAASALATIVVGRIIAGVGVGFVSAIIILYMSEICPRKVRGALVSGYQFAITICSPPSSATTPRTATTLARTASPSVLDATA